MDHLSLWQSMTHEEQKTLKAMSEDREIEKHLIESVFPNIYGNDEVRILISVALTSDFCLRSNLASC